VCVSRGLEHCQSGIVVSMIQYEPLRIAHVTSRHLELSVLAEAKAKCLQRKKRKLGRTIITTFLNHVMGKEATATHKFPHTSQQGGWGDRKIFESFVMAAILSQFDPPRNVYGLASPPPPPQS
jgi:hypothetical protein